MVEQIFTQTPARIGAMRRALRRLAEPDVRVTSLAFLGDREMAALRAEAAAQTYRMATPVIEHRGNRVRQDFEVCFPAPRIGAFAQLATLLEASIMAACDTCDLVQPILPTDLSVDLADFAIQRYPAGSAGIGIHRDGKRYRGLVVIVTLDGISRLFTCEDRDGRNKRRIDDRPGRIVLMSAEGFAGRQGESARPLHGVDRVTAGRLSLGFRCAPVGG